MQEDGATFGDGGAQGSDKGPCQCGWYFRADEEGNVIEGGACAATTSRQFAPGHDARLKGLLIRAGIAGAEVSMHDGAMLVSKSADQAAMAYGFYQQVLHGIELGKGAQQAKYDKADAKVAARVAAKKAAPKSERTVVRKDADLPIAAAAEEATKTRPVAVADPVAAGPLQIKIGQKQYAAEVDETGDAHYTNVRGEQRVARAGSYSKVG